MTYDLYNRQYPFPLNYLASDGGTVDDTFVDGNPDNTIVGNNWYVLCLTGQEMIDLQSVINIGAPIMLPDTYMDIVQKYTQLAQFPNEIPEDTCMDLCQLILDCIEQEASLQQAIATYSLASPIPQNQPEQQTGLDAELINNPPACDEDIVFGMTTGYTDLMNIISEDILEIAVAATSPAGRIGDIIEAIPVIGEAPLDDIFQFVESFMVDMNDAYAAAYTSQIRDDIRCDLFCLAIDDCNLTLEQARDYFFDKLAETISLNVWNGFLDDLIGISYSGISTVWAMHLLITQTIIFGGELIGYDTSRLIATIQSLFNDPDSDWVGLCDDCTWDCVTDFADVDGNFTLPIVFEGVSAGVWVTTVGWDSTDLKRSSTAWARMLQIELAFADPVFVEDITLNYDYTKGTFEGADVNALQILSKLGGLGGSTVDNTVILRSAVSNGSGQNLVASVDGTIDYIRLFIRCSQRTSATYNGSLLANTFTINGTGTKPPELECE